MAFTTEQLEAVETALASGTKTVKYGDREVTYHSLGELMKLRDVMQRELGVNTTTRYTLAAFDRE